MKRKLIQHGPNSLGVSLPSEWVRAHNLKKGDNVEIEEEEIGLVIGGKGKNEEKSIELDISEYYDTFIIKKITQFYREGYTHITLLYKKPTITHLYTKEEQDLRSRIAYITSRLIGLEIVSSTEKSIKLQFLFTDAETDVNQIVRQVFLLTKEYMAVLEKAATQKSPVIDVKHEMHDTIAKFINLGIRGLYVNKFDKSIYMLFILVDQIADYIRRACEKLEQETSISDQTRDLLAQMNKIFILFYEGYYKRDQSLLNSALMARSKTMLTLRNEKSLQKTVYMYMGMLDIVILMVENCVPI